MIAYIQGKITFKSPTAIIVQTNGIGYWVEVTVTTANQLVLGQEIQILTHLIIREDAHTLYGFLHPQEKEMFTHLIAVSGVGPNTARILLSALTPEEIRAAVIAEKDSILRNAKGIGPKNAKRIILELKDKLLKESGATSEAIALTLVADNQVREEALAALVALGFNKIQVQKTLNQILKESPDIQDAGELIKIVLTQLT